MRSLVALLVGGLLSTGAWAQTSVGFDFVEGTEPYVSLSGATPLTLGSGGGSHTDEGGWLLPLAFANGFSYRGQTYSQVFISVNGFISFGTPPAGCTIAPGLTSTYCRTYDLAGAGRIPSLSEPNGMIAPFFDDLETGSGSLQIVNSAAGFAVEWVGVRTFFGTNAMTMQVRLSPTGEIAVAYGPFSGTGGSGIAGFEDALGNGASFLRLSGASGACTSANQANCCSSAGSNCDLGDWVPNRIIRFGVFADPDIEVVRVDTANQRLDADGGLSFDVQPTFRNNGQRGASGWEWSAFLSQDTSLDFDGGDVLVHHSGPTDAGPLALFSETGAAFREGPLAQGAYYVIVRADDGLDPDGGLPDGGHTGRLV